MSIVIVTGANKGIGRETARRLVEQGHTVYAAARDQQLGKATADEIGALFVQLDVTDDDSVAAAMEAVGRREPRLDVLINNAGITDNTMGVEGLNGSTALAVLDTNVAGVVRVTQAAIPLLRKAQTPVIVNVVSGLGSFAANTDPDRPESSTPLIAYAASKAAVAMLTLKYSQALPDFKVNAVAPGFTATDFTADFGGGQPVEEAVDVLLRMATLDAAGPTGTCEENAGPLAW